MHFSIGGKKGKSPAAEGGEKAQYEEENSSPGHKKIEKRPHPGTREKTPLPGWGRKGEDIYDL